MKQQVNKRRKKAKEWEKKNKIILSMKDLVFKERLVKKLTNWYISPYIIKKVVSIDTVKSRLPTSISIYLVMNVSWVVRYKKLVKGQKVKERKLIKVKGMSQSKL